MNFSEEEKEIGKKIFDKFKNGRKNPKWATITFENVFKIINKKEREIFDRILKEGLSEYKNKKLSRFFGIRPVPKNLVLVNNQKYVFNGKEGAVKDQYVPKNVFLDFETMNKAMSKDIKRGINIVSGYRSPAYQLVVFFCNLVDNNWDFRKTIQRVALPGWSEHGFSSKQALDVAPVKGISRLENFYRTKEYKWLLNNAERFNFYLSFPRGNKRGMIFEPWHWHYDKK